MLKRSPQLLGRRLDGRPLPPLSKMLRWHPDAEDPYGRYSREDRRPLPVKAAGPGPKTAAA
jgi:hypothetical protein